MNARVSSAVSLIIHLVLLTMVSMITLRSQKIVPPPAGMEIDISDFEHAMPLPQPSIARSEDAQGAVVPETREADQACGVYTEIDLTYGATLSVEQRSQLLEQRIALKCAS